MKIIFLGSDRTFFRDSPGRRRAALYGTIFSEVHFVVFSGTGFKKEAIAENVFLHPTNSYSRWTRPLRAFGIAYGVLKQSPGSFIVSAEDAFEIGLVGYALKKVLGVKLQLQIHTDFLSPYFVRERWENRIRARIAHLILRHADCIRVVSGRIRDSLVKSLDLSREKISVLPIWQEAINITRHDRQSLGELRILIISRLESEKGVEDALQAFAEFLKRGGRGRLTIVGTGSRRGMLEAMARDLGVANEVIFYGWQGDLTSRYQETDLYLLPSHYEGWGMAAFDAVRSQIPVLATDVGLAGEAVQDGFNGVVIPVGDVEKMAAALLSFHKNPERLAELSRGPVEDPIRTWDEYLKKYRASMERCLSPE